MNVDIQLRDQEEARVVLGPLDKTARMLREHFEVQLVHRGDQLKISGDEDRVGKARAVLDRALRKLRKGYPLTHAEIEAWIVGDDSLEKSSPESERAPEGLPERAFPVQPRSRGQKNFLGALRKHAVTFVVGPAGTGKTYLAVAAAVAELRAGSVRRIVLCRPAVEAGEKLGFLPGDFQAKINPYLRPLYDALGDLTDPNLLPRYLESGIIEVCPLAYMRGRTLNDSFVILDEAQNTTVSQMRMFLTRMGEGSRVVVTGDLTQVDLPKGEPSGLVDAVDRLEGVKGLTIVQLTKKDIVRHPVVEAIVEAYERSQTRMPSPEDRKANPVRRSRRRN